MSDVLVALIGAAGLIAVALIANRGRQHAKAARNQVENNHKTNLREEFDERHHENAEKLDALVAWQAEHQIQGDARSRHIARLEVVMVPLIASTVFGAAWRLTGLIRRHRKG